MKVDIGFWDINGNYIEDIQELNEIERKEIMETKNFNEFFDELNDMANFKNFGKKEEEIIIDGVNVEDCSYYNKDNYPYCCEVWDNECEAQNCYYKQLKRLEQENTDLKKYIERMDKPVVEVVDADIALENAELKEKNTALEETLQTIEQLKDEDSLRIAQLVTENARLKNERTADLVKQIDELKEENERLKKDKIGLHSEIKQLEQENYGLNQELLGYKKGVQASEIIELKQTLHEIKAIAEGHTELCTKCEQQRKECDCGDICNAYRLVQIIDKISEVIE